MRGVDRGLVLPTLALAALACLAPVALADAPEGLPPASGDLPSPQAVADGVGAALADPQAAVSDPGVVTRPITDPPGAGHDPAPEQPAEPGFAERVADVFREQAVLAGVAGLTLAAAGFTAFALVGRYVDPKEALENPQRSMLYGFIRGHPGVHLKKLSDEFGMKTSSILWHIRKLEGAQLVRSDRANGFRVFYPVEGGMSVKQLSRAIANLQNHNALRLFEAVATAPGRGAPDVVREVGIHAGTARWHLRRMREAGLLEEAGSGPSPKLFPTDLGRRAFEAGRAAATTPAGPAAGQPAVPPAPATPAARGLPTP